MEHLKWLFIDAWSLLLLEVIMARKGGEILGKGIKNMCNIYLYRHNIPKSILSTCIMTWSPSHVPSGWVNFLYIALIASKLVDFPFVVIYYVGLNTNIPHYTWMCITLIVLSSSCNYLHSCMNISIAVIFIASSYLALPS